MPKLEHAAEGILGKYSRGDRNNRGDMIVQFRRGILP